jgi:hypothetical protein
MTRHTIAVAVGLLLAGNLLNAAEISLSVDNAAPGVGGTIAVTVHANVAAGESFVSANQFLSFDKAKLELTNQAAGTAAGFTEDSRGLAAINAAGEVHAGIFSTNAAFSPSLTLGVFRFRALASGTTVVSLRGYDVTNAPFGNLLVRLNDSQIVPGGAGSLTITIGGGGELDSDGDGMPDSWMNLHFGHASGQAADLSRADDDPDHDGMSNWDEYKADTIPTNAASCLVLYSLTNNPALPGKYLVRWQSVAGKHYAVQATTNLLIGFSDLQTNILATPVVNVHTDNVAGVGCRFYRVKVE